MSDIDRLPSNWRRSFINLSTASEAVRGALLQFHPDWNVVYTTFLGDALTAEWAAAKTNGTAAAVTVASSQLTCTAGTDNDGYAGQGFGMHWTADAGVYMESEQSLDNVSDSKIEIGLTDAVDDAGAVALKATPTGTANDWAVLVFDTDDNAEFDIISEIDNGGPAAAAEDVHTIVAGTDFTSIIRGQNDVVSVGIGSGSGNILTIGATTAASLQGGTAITPWWFCQTRTTSTKILTVNYALVAGPIA